MSNTNLVLLGDYSDDQAGYDSAKVDGAVHIVQIDEQSYSSMYNVQQAIQTTCNCLGGDVSLGLVKDGKYLPFSQIETGDNNDDYQDLDDAFELGLQKQLDALRDAVDESLKVLSEILPEGEERRIIDHCTDCIDQHHSSKGV